jgi:RsiW-degrading membrane proteinase PrsW (M82 family)
MENIYLVTLIFSLVSIVLVLWLLRFLVKVEYRRVHLLLFLVALPLSFLVNLLVKKPLLDVILKNSPGVPLAHLGFPALLATWLLAPVTEELVKILPVAFPPIRKSLRAGPIAVGIGLVLGLGFAVSECWYLARNVVDQNPFSADLPLRQYGWFMGERLLSLTFHCTATSFIVTALGLDRTRGALAYFAMVLFHAFTNTPVVLYRSGEISIETTRLLLGVVLVAVLVLFLFLMKRFGPRNGMPTDPESDVST